MNIGQMTAWIDGDDLARECEEEKKRQEKRRVSHDVSVCHSLVSTAQKAQKTWRGKVFGEENVLHGHPSNSWPPVTPTVFKEEEKTVCDTITILVGHHHHHHHHHGG